MNITFFVVLIYKKFNYPKKKVVSGRFTISEKKNSFHHNTVKKVGKIKMHLHRTM